MADLIVYGVSAQLHQEARLTSALAWYPIHQDPDVRTHSRMPELVDGDEVTVRLRDGTECLAVWSRRGGWKLSESDPRHGTDESPSCYTDHALDGVEAVGFAKPGRKARAGERYQHPRIALTVPQELLDQLTDAAEHHTDGDRSELIRTACRGWLLLLTREDKIPLTEAEWEWVATGETP